MYHALNCGIMLLWTSNGSNIEPKRTVSRPVLCYKAKNYGSKHTKIIRNSKSLSVHILLERKQVGPPDGTQSVRDSTNAKANTCEWVCSFDQARACVALRNTYGCRVDCGMGLPQHALKIA